MTQRSNEDQRHGRLYDDLRKKLLDLSRRNPMLNYKHRAGSRRQLRIVNANLETGFAELAVKQTELSFAALPEPDDIPEDELSEIFKATLGHAKSTDLDYLTRLAALDSVARQDDASLANLEGWLRERVRQQLELPPRPNRKEFNLIDHARKKDIDPNYELSSQPPTNGKLRNLQSMFFADELDSRLARIAADARLSEQETGLSTLFLAMGFLRWYESNDSDVPNFAPLLLLPVQLSKRLQGRRAIYSVKAASETPDINLSLRELMLRNSPDVSRHLPDFDEETDGVESYFEKVLNNVDGLNRWRIERNLTLGHFAFGRLAMYEDLASENWQQSPIEHALIESLLQGSDLESPESLSFASDYDLDDESVENSAPILINDADASQHSAIVDVMNGKNLVIEGPPGTGKSQTITNIIANALYTGQTILFLADKLAALEVVKDRLDAGGLGDFCLELHSDKAHPKPIVESLKQRHQLIQHAAAEPNWRDELQRLRNTRVRVREYLSALHGRDCNDDRTPFHLIWSTIAARRELTTEFEVARRISLDGIFSKGPHEVERCKEALKLYVRLVQDYEQRHGAFAEAEWSSANVAVMTVDDPDVIADKIRDAYEAAKALSDLFTTASANTGFDLPIRLGAAKNWVDSISKLPLITEDSFLPELGVFSSEDLETAVRLATERIELADNPIADIGPGNDEAFAHLCMQVSQASLAEVSPIKIIAHAAWTEAHGSALIESLNVFSPLIAAFEPSTSNVSMASDMARIVKFAAAVPPELDRFLGFDQIESESILTRGASRLDELVNREQSLRDRLKIPDHQRWPASEDLRIAVEVCSAKGLDKIRASFNGKRRCTRRVIGDLGDGTITANDLNEIIALVEDERSFLEDSSLATAAGAFWSGPSTPFKELTSVLSLRKRFGIQIGVSAHFVNSVYRVLFSSNSKVVSALRSYAAWSERLLPELSQWPDTLEDAPLAGAADRINARTTTLKALASKVRQMGLSELTVPFAQVQLEIERRRKLKALDATILSNPALARIGERAWRSSGGCRDLRQSSEIAEAIMTASPPPEIRARLFSHGTADFRRLLDKTSSSLKLALTNYELALREISTISLKNSVDGSQPPQTVADQLGRLISALPSLREWIDVAQRRSQLEASGVDPLVKAFEDAKLPLHRLPETLDAMAFYHRVMRARHTNEALRNMRGIDLENERERFVAVDESLKKRQREAVRMKLLKAEVPAGNNNGPRRTWTELQCLRNEFTKQTKYLPIRRLLSQSARAIQSMKPCFMMSPLSLAKFLPSQVIKFDLLVIDEASQMRPEDSLGALLRAKKVVVVGDPNQLPPTDFFSRVTPADEGGTDNEDDADDIDAESILDWSLKTFQAPRRLKWHYRSRCESLIAFSNHEFYSSNPGSHGDLITFPNARPESFAIDLVQVKGFYRSSRNPSEVAQIVEAAIDFMIQHADLPEDKIPTLGIVAINIQQRDAIREEFNRSGRDDAIERYLSACNKGTSKRGPEPFFIKNLENVQGDERDFIMISLTYGREVGQERVAQRFGPIARADGHRRLNVLFTRARERVVLFSSMGSEDILVNATSKRGVRVLRDYLRYVESRRLEVGTTTGRDFDSDFERDVRARLEARGFVVDPQVGVAGYRIDLGVRHPIHPTVYLAGIECDGATFHGSKSARDRDRLRESVLRGKGWAILRVWSTDWFADADLQTDRLIAELQRLASHSVRSRMDWTMVRVSPSMQFGLADLRDLPETETPSLAATPEDGGEPIIMARRCNGAGLDETALDEVEVKKRLRAFRDTQIIRDFPELDPERCILRDIMINKIVESRLDEPKDFTRKIPLWLRERTDQKQVKYLETICSVVELL